MRQTPCRRHARCSVQKIATAPATIRTMTSGHGTEGGHVQRRVLLLASCYPVTRSHERCSTVGPHTRGGPQSALRRGGDEVPFCRGAPGARRIFPLSVLVVTHDGWFPRSEHFCPGGA